MSKIGRNNPCPCGSGKKYKHCCKDKIEAEQYQEQAQENIQQGFTPEEIQRMKEDQQRSVYVKMSKVALENAKKLPGNEHGELDAITWKLETAVQFEENKADIVKVAKLLSQYHAEFHAWVGEHHTEAVQHALQLFAETPFGKVRFKKEDIKRIFKKQGAPPDFAKTESFQEYVFRALNVLIDDLEAQSISQYLLLQIPYYYSQKRYNDACMILGSAYQISDFKKKKNTSLPPFLFCKFTHALQTWEGDLEQDSIGILQKIGLGIDGLRKKFQSKGKKKDLNLSED